MGSSSLIWILSSYGETIIVWHWIEFCSGVCSWANHWFLYPSEICLLNLVWKTIKFAFYEDSDGDGEGVIWLIYPIQCLRFDEMTI